MSPSAPTSARKWSSQQNAIFEWFATGTGNLVVRARAGTGKTTTILEAVGRAPESKILLAAFNKRIADELTAKITAPNCEAKTLHAVGFAVIRRYWNGTRIENTRGGRLAVKVAGQDAPDAMVALVKRLAGYGKGMAPLTGIDETLTEQRGARNQPLNAGVVALMEIAESMDCVPDEEWEDDGWTVERIATLAQRAMRAAMTRDGEIDFDDMIFLPLANNWMHPSFNMVVVDEAQDMNAAQILLAQRSCKGRIAVVGDDRQAIYGFRGADSGSIDRLKAELRAVEMPLTVTYRCPKSVVAIAAGIVPDYMAAPTAPEGEVVKAKVEQIAALAGAGDFVLSRKNAPLTTICLSLLRAGKRAKIEGKDIGKHLVAIVRKIKAKSMPDFLKKLTAWESREIARAEKSAKNPDAASAKADKISDEAATLRGLCEGLSGVRELEARIVDLFADTDGAPNAIVCSSVHRSKGLEADRVFLLVDTLYPRKRADVEEKNIHYVAVTRAKRTLVLVDGVPGGDK